MWPMLSSFPTRNVVTRNDRGGTCDWLSLYVVILATTVYE